MILQAWWQQSVPAHNDALAGLTASFTNLYPNATASLYDIYSFWSSVVTHPGAYGFANAVSPCLGQSQNSNLAYGFNNTICPNPDDLVYFDLIHPSKHFHQAIAQDFISKLGPVLNSV